MQFGETSKPVRASYFRSFVFGVEDSLVSTVGLLSGIAIAGVPRVTIFITGVVLVFVEAFSMAAGSFLSESSAQEYESGKVNFGNSLYSGMVMFFSYFVSGFVPLFPYVVFPVETAFPLSVGCSLVALFILGLGSGSIARKSILRHGLRMFFVGGIAIAVGVGAGMLADTLRAGLIH